MKYGQVLCKMNTYKNDSKSNLMKVKIVVMHDGANLNGTKFSKDSMKKAEDSIKNVPILGHVTRDSYGDLDDFDGHNMETRIIDSDKGFDVETYYIEKPIGVIPESCNPRYEDIDGYTYLVVDGYIWKSYSNGAYKLIENNEFKGVSMEISIRDGKFDDNDYAYEIFDYQYEGVTVLGDNVPAAMGEHTKITKYSKCTDYKSALEEICSEIYSLESEVKSMENEEVVIEVVETVEENIIVEEETNNVESSVIEIEETIETNVEDDKSKSAVVIDEEGINIIIESKEDEVYPLDVFSILFEEVPNSLKEIAVKLHEKFEKMNSELETLNQFKATKEKEELTVEVDKIITEFSELSADEVEDIRNKVIDSKMDMDLFKDKLASLAYSKIKTNKGTYSVKTKEIVPIIEKNEENGYEPYGGIFK